ncbi:hypothetical protein D3C73_1295090 [compost metagenome]
MVAQNIDRTVELFRQTLFIDRQFAQPEQDVSRLVVGGDLGELEAAEQQIVGVGGDVLQLQFVPVHQLPQLLLNVVLGSGQEGQRVAQ